jgi:hypothetical protein
MGDYFRDRMVIGPGETSSPVEGLPAGTAAAAYSLATVIDCPGMLEALNAPSILRIAADYIGCKPTISSVGVRWSFPAAEEGTRTQQYHRDLDDWRFLKLFIYLTDVDSASGPHTFVKSSHRSAFGLKAKAYEQAELETRFGAEAITAVTGPRGTSFLADTLGIHRGTSPVDRPRLIFQVQYSLLPIFAFTDDPVERAGVGFDAYCNRLLVRAPRPALLN